LQLNIPAGMIALKDSLGSDFVERVRRFFGPDGPPRPGAQFRIRPEQQAMAVAVAETLEEESHLVVEAGTAWANRSPTSSQRCLYAIEEKRRRSSPPTRINLQEQLLHKDIPIVKKILPIEFRGRVDEKGGRIMFVRAG
jgi:ATP-dependent DNA helicase DinG